MGKNKEGIINKALKKYRSAWRQNPCIFDICNIELVYLIWDYLGNPLDICYLLSTDKWFTGFRNDPRIWKTWYFNWFGGGTKHERMFKDLGKNSRLEYLDSAVSTDGKSVATYKGFINQTYEMLKSFWWKDAPIYDNELENSSSWLGDSSSGVYLYDRLLIPSIEK